MTFLTAFLTLLALAFKLVDIVSTNSEVKFTDIIEQSPSEPGVSKSMWLFGELKLSGRSML